jgi:ribonucleoside-triphosphate reductase (thioredoxin)
MYDRMFTMKFLPPGRGLWTMGTDIVNKKGLAAALNNCGFVSTVEISKKFSKPFVFTMDMSMLGVGIGFDTKGAGSLVVQKPDIEEQLYVVEDTREGWVKSVGDLIDSFNCGVNPLFDYSKIRPIGTPLKTFGGVSSGPQPLIDLHVMIREVLAKNVGSPVTATTIVDIMNVIGKCVVSGNLRRSALISFGDSSDEFMDLKDYSKNPHRAAYGWTSNNSIFADLGMDYQEAAKRMCINGEPGIAWLDNMKRYSRMCDPPDDKVRFRHHALDRPSHSLDDRRTPE